jgi:TM2 domain-containing membrane protein YozV
MQLTCRRCNGSFTVAGNAPQPCPACGSIEVYAQQTMPSPKARTAERPMSAFSAPVSQPVAPMPPSALAPYAPAAPSYPAPPQQQQWGPPPQQQYPQQQYAPQPGYQAYPPPVQVVIQNQIGPVPYPVAPYAIAPYARRKDAGVATLLSFFLPGAGQLYNGQVGKGLAFLLVTLFVNLPLMFVGVGFLTGLITWIWGMMDAHSSAERINRGEIVV